MKEKIYPQLLLLADDFTGALDTGVQLAKKGITTVVQLEWKGKKTNTESSVLAINTAARHLSPQKAEEIYREILFQYREIPYVYLKTDSALRGNLSAAFAAAQKERREAWFFVPAYPAADRWTKEGYHYIVEDLVENSVFRKDPRTPVTESYIPSVLSKDFPIKTDVLSADFMKAGFAKDTVYVVDGRTKEDLEHIGARLAEQKLLGCLAGCAGFAEILPELLPELYPTLSTDSCEEFSRKKFLLFTEEPVLFLSGSANEITFAQLAWAKEAGYPVLDLAEIFHSSSADRPKEIERMAEAVVRYLIKGQSVIVASATSEESLGKNTEESEEIQVVIDKTFAELTERISAKRTLKNLAIFGGDTALTVLNALKITEVVAKTELATGTAVSTTLGENPINIVTKSGGLGSLESVKIIEDILRGRRSIC